MSVVTSIARNEVLLGLLLVGAWFAFFAFHISGAGSRALAVAQDEEQTETSWFRGWTATLVLGILFVAAAVVRFWKASRPTASLSGSLLQKPARASGTGLSMP